MAQPLTGYFLGRRPYAPTLELMQQLFSARRDAEVGDTVLLLEHEPVITMGRGAKAENLLAAADDLKKLGVDVVATGRGGDITLHAPGQLVAYPIVDLNPDRRDVRKYVQKLTEVMRRLALRHGIDAGTMTGMIGLWTDVAACSEWPGEQSAQQPGKIGAIGVRISRWITQHGFALNLTTDLSLYQLIVPCGIAEYPVVSVQSLTSVSPDLKEEARHALFAFDELLGTGQASWIDVESMSLDEVLRAARDRPDAS